VKLERHVGGLSIARKVDYLLKSGWLKTDGGLWQSPVPVTDPVSLKWAVHHQLTRDLVDGLARLGWKVIDYSERGYARLEDPLKGDTCALPAALRRQARRQKVLVRDLTVGLFDAATTGRARATLGRGPC
jgi:hypothetical protein